MAKINSYILLLFFALLSSLSFSQIPPLYNTFFEDEFYTDTLSEKWSISTDSKYTLTKQNGYLQLPCQNTENQEINLISISAITSYLQATTTLNFNPKINGEQAGICLYQNNVNQVLFKLKKEDNENVLILQIKIPNQPYIIQKDLVLNKYQNHLELKIGSAKEKYYFYYRLKSNDLWEIVDSLPINLVSKTNSPPKIGLFTSSDNQPSKNYAAFDLFRYYELKQ